MKRNSIVLIILVILCSCNKFYSEIEIKNIKNVEKSMMIISSLMDKKVDIDSVSINARIDKLKKEDTLNKAIVTYYESWDYNAPKKKAIYITKDNSVFLHNVEIAKNLEEFSKHFEQYHDFNRLSRKEKLNFLSSLKNLAENNIWSCSQEEINDIQIFVFTYSKDNLFHSKDSQRYLFLKQDISSVASNKAFTDQYELLDEKGGIALYAGRRTP